MSVTFLPYSPTQFFIRNAKMDSIPIVPVLQNDLSAWKEGQGNDTQSWIEATGFKGKAGELCLIPNHQNKLTRIVFGLGDTFDFWSFGILPNSLPEGAYHLEANTIAADPLFRACLAWMLGAYQFTKYKKCQTPAAQLVCPEGIGYDQCLSQAEGIYFTRDLINTPAEDMGPAELTYAAQQLGKLHKANVEVLIGDELLTKNFPAIHTVGRASNRDPRLIEMRWQPQKATTTITLIGKGVTFDSGGLDLKPSSNMLNMKKDMGGAANVLGLAHMLMSSKINANLRILIPTADNMVSANSYKPKDIITTRSGLTVEVGNTDAEGRLLLCDAITYALEDKTDLLIDCATLTGAARIALGLELPALFCNNDALSTDLMQHSKFKQDPLWPMPLWDGYRNQMKGKISDLSSTGASAYGGAITAALYLEEFVLDSANPETPWAHFDIMAWNTNTQPGRPEGGEAMGIRSILGYLQQITR